MASSMAITVSLHRGCSPHHVTKKRQPQARPAHPIGTKLESHAIALETESPKGLKVEPETKIGLSADSSTTNSMAAKADEAESGLDPEPSAVKFSDKRWKNGTWDLNMFVIDGKMDWDGVIVAGMISSKHNYIPMFQAEALDSSSI